MTENQNLKSKPQKEKSEKELEKEEEQKRLKIESLRKAGKIAQDVKKFIKPKIKIGTKAIDIISTT